MGCASRPKQSRDRPLRRSRAKAGEGAVCVYTAIGEDSSGDFSTNSVTVNSLGTNTYAYDLNGNLTNDGCRSFLYDDENQLIAVWLTNSWSNSFAYDGKMRRRIERDYAYLPSSSSYLLTNEVHFIYDGNVVIEERNAGNVPLVCYTRGNDLSGGLQGAGGIGGLLARTTFGQELPGAPTTAFYHADGNGNITALLYPNQQLAAKYLYDPFGNALAMSGPLMNFNKYRFSSKEWNDSSGSYYYGRRFYDPHLQRWANRDPINEKGGLNLYRYAMNDPDCTVDPFGLDVYKILEVSDTDRLCGLIHHRFIIGDDGQGGTYSIEKYGPSGGWAAFFGIGMGSIVYKHQDGITTEDWLRSYLPTGNEFVWKHVKTDNLVDQNLNYWASQMSGGPDYFVTELADCGNFANQWIWMAKAFNWCEMENIPPSDWLAMVPYADVF